MRRLFKASSFYPGALEAHYRNAPGLAEETFSQQWASLSAQLLVGTDFWSRGLGGSSPFQIFETVLNCEPLQRAWARENAYSWPAGDWHLPVLLAQIQAFAPEILFSHDFEFLRSDFRREARRRAPTIALVLGWDGIAKNDSELFCGCDLMLSCIPHVTDFYRSRGFQSALLPYSFHPDLLENLTPSKQRYPVSFVGSIQLKSNLHFRRAKCLYRALRSLPLTLHASGTIANWSFRHREQRRLLRHLHLRQAWVRHELGRKNLGPLFGKPMFQCLADSDITLNIHIDAARGQASNMRLFEATGMGTCLLTEAHDDLHNYFVPDVEVATYRDPEHLVEKAKWLIANPAERSKIARAGQVRTLRDHCFAHRIPLLDQILARAMGHAK